MKSLVVYDSVYGNTETIAKAIGIALSGAVLVRRVGEANPSDLSSIDLIVVGSPTQAGRPTQAIQKFLDGLPRLAEGFRVAAFDTRSSSRWAAVFGFASKRIAEALKSHGGTLVAPPEAFYVTGKEGPLRDGEAARAATWAKMLSESRD